MHIDYRSVGSLFHARIDELKDLSFLESIQRILALVVDKVRKSGEFAESVIGKIIDTFMNVALDMLNINREQVPICTVL